MRDDRLCPKCLRGRRFVRTSTPIANGMQVQYLVCPACGEHSKQTIPRSMIFTRVCKLQTKFNKNPE